MRGAQAVANAPNITQSALFHVAKHAYPAPYGDTAAESHMQQALFANGSLNTGEFIPRYYVKNSTRISTTDSMTCFLRWK